MSKAHQDPVNWPYGPNFYPQPRGYNIPYQQGRVCQESCCRRTRGSLSYPPPFPPSLPCRSSQDNSYIRPSSSQARGFMPVNPYLQQHGGHPQHPQSTVHRPIPQARYDYNDFYRYGNGTNNSNGHQGFHPAVLKQNTNSYSVPSAPHVTEQYPACSHYTPSEQEPSLPSLDVRQFLATWQDKDEEVFENDQQNKPKAQFQEPPPNPDSFKPLDCSKRNESSHPMYGYTHNQVNNHAAYYNKPIQGVPNHQSVNESAFKSPSYTPGNSYHGVPVENDCKFTTSQVNMSPHTLIETDSQHVGYERRIEKIFNPHGCKGLPAALPNEQNHCAVNREDHNMNIKATVSEKNQYHLSASLESEDLFDDINRKREERQRNIVHPLCYQESYSQRINGNLHCKPDVPHVSVKPNTATPILYPPDNIAGHITNMDGEMDLKRPKSLPLKKWMQKRKKSEDEFFPSFNVNEHSIDFSNRETVIERSHISSPCDPNTGIPLALALTVNDTSCSANVPEENHNIIHVPIQNAISNEMAVTSYPQTLSNTEKTACESDYPPVDSILESSLQVDSLQSIIPCPTVSLSKAAVDSNQALAINSDDIDINLSPCNLVVEDQQRKEGDATTSYHVLEEEGKNEISVHHIYDKPLEGNFETGQVGVINEVDSVPKTQEENQEEGISNGSKDTQEEPSSTSSNALTTIAYMYDDETIVSENSLDSSQIESNSKLLSLSTKLKGSPNKLRIVKHNRVLTLWRHRNRLLHRPSTSKRTLMVYNKWKGKELSETQCTRESSKFYLQKQKKLWKHKKRVTHQGGYEYVKDQESEVVSVVLTSLVNGVCHVEDSSELVNVHSKNDVDSQEHSLPSSGGSCTTSENIEAIPKVTLTVESDVIEDDNSNLVVSEDCIGYTEGSVVEGSDDRVLEGILNWPHREEEITSINEKESIKVSLPWVKIFKPHSSLPDAEKTLEIGPARIELRYSPAPIEYQPGHFKSSRSVVEKKSSIFSVKKVLLKHNANSTTERLPKMVIKKTGCEEYKSYIKDAKLRVISIKNSNKDGQAEVIIETDRPLIGSSDENSNPPRIDAIPLDTLRDQERPEPIPGPEVSETSSDASNEFHHCLLCQESFTSIEKLRSHENSLSHRHIDIIQRSVLHKLQKTKKFKGAVFPEFQPLSATEIEYLNWRPNFSGYNHFYHNVPL